MFWKLLTEKRGLNFADNDVSSLILAGGGFHSPMDIFDMFFGGGGGRRQRGPAKGKDVIHQLKVSDEYWDRLAG